MFIHRESHPQAGEVVEVRLRQPIPVGVDAGAEAFEKFRIEDWWDVVTGTVWRDVSGALGASGVARGYAFRVGSSVKPSPNPPDGEREWWVHDIPADDEVVYGHNQANGIGHLIHVSEIVKARPASGARKE